MCVCVCVCERIVQPLPQLLDWCNQQIKRLRVCVVVSVSVYQNTACLHVVLSRRMSAHTFTYTHACMHAHIHTLRLVSMCACTRTLHKSACYPATISVTQQIPLSLFLPLSLDHLCLSFSTSLFTSSFPSSLSLPVSSHHFICASLTTTHMQSNPTNYISPRPLLYTLRLALLLSPSVHHTQEVDALAEWRLADGINVHYPTILQDRELDKRGRKSWTEMIEISPHQASFALLVLQTNHKKSVCIVFVGSLVCVSWVWLAEKPVKCGKNTAKHSSF